MTDLTTPHPEADPPRRSLLGSMAHGTLAALQSAIPTPAAAATVQVKSYKNAKEYERDARKMVAAGWHPEGQSESQGRMRVGRTVGKVALMGPLLALGFGGASRKSGKLTVTWLREPVATSA